MFQPDDILIKRYRLQKQLGRTAAGHQTWLAVDLQSPIETVAKGWKNWAWMKWIKRVTDLFKPKIYQQITIKLLAFSPQMQWDDFKLFERETQILQTLNHPKIPRYHNSFEIDKEDGGGIPWFALVQDYIPGSSLQELLEKGQRFSENQIRSIATEVLEILTYLHQLNPSVLHRDIKPGNLILGENGLIYLIDFGAVQAQAAKSGITFTVVGTSGYTPLEQFLARAVPASDLYALGATLIHLLTGIAPTDLIHNNSRIEFSDKITIKPGLKKWLNKLTEVIVENRYQNTKEALEDLQSIHLLKATNSNVYQNELSSFAIQPPKTKIQIAEAQKQLDIAIPTAKSSFLKVIFNSFLSESSFIAARQLFFLILIGNGLIIPLVLDILALIIKDKAWIVWSFAISGTVYFSLILLIFIYYLLNWWGGKTRLHFTAESWQIKQKILGIALSVIEEPYSNIVGVFIHEKSNQYQVSINTRNHIYFLGEKLNRHEALWLAKTIEDWLQ